MSLNYGRGRVRGDHYKFSDRRREHREARSPEALERRREERLDRNPFAKPPKPSVVSVVPSAPKPPPPPDDLLHDAELLLDTAARVRGDTFGSPDDRPARSTQNPASGFLPALAITLAAASSDRRRRPNAPYFYGGARVPHRERADNPRKARTRDPRGESAHRRRRLTAPRPPADTHCSAAQRRPSRSLWHAEL
jgi:hypothetical protein